MDAENGRETFNNNKIESNYEENDMKEMGDKIITVMMMKKRMMTQMKKKNTPRSN